MGQFPSNLLHEPSPCVLPSRQRTLVAPQAHGEDLVLKISNSFHALADCSPKFLPKLFFPLKMVGSPWPTSATSFHSGEPPNGLKQLKRGSQWGFSQAFPLMMIKVIIPFNQTKANLKITTCITPWGPKPLLLTKNQSLRAPPNSI